MSFRAFLGRLMPALLLTISAVAAAELPTKQVLVEICEKDVPRDGKWPASPPVATETYTEDVFGLFELPQKYISTGVRGDRASPTLVRASARVTIPAGAHRVL